MLSSLLFHFIALFIVAEVFFSYLLVFFTECIFLSQIEPKIDFVEYPPQIRSVDDNRIHAEYEYDDRLTAETEQYLPFHNHINDTFHFYGLYEMTNSQFWLAIKLYRKYDTNADIIDANLPYYFSRMCWLT